MHAVAAAVQDLQQDAAAGRVHGVGHRAVLGELALVDQVAGAGLHAALDVGGVAAGDHQAAAQLRPRRIEGGQGRHRGHARLLQIGVHRAHDDAVGQREGAEVDRREQVRVGHRMGLRGCGGRVAAARAGLV